MTREEAIEMLKAKLECITRDVSGRDDDCNRRLCGECRLNYEKGTMGEQKEYLRMSIEALEQEPRWIPVSEKLPSDGKYLVTRGDVIGRPMIGMRYFSKDLSKVDEFDFVDKKCISGWCEYDSEYGWYIDDKVTAWMPLPEPYKAESEEENG